MSVYYDKTRHRYRLDLRYNGYRIAATNKSNQPLERMQSIILSNNMPYDKAKMLVTDYKKGLIPPGYIGHKYFCSDVGYRIMTSYNNFDGYICKYYQTAEEAWNDPRIQSCLKTANGQKHGDYNKYLATVDSGRPWNICVYTILRCRLTVHGSILATKKR